MKKIMKKGLALMTCAALLAGLLSACSGETVQSSPRGKAGKLSEAVREESSDAAAPEDIYQRFLEGTGTATAGETITSFSGGDYTLQEILSCVETAFRDWSMPSAPESVEYAMIDCGQDGVPELALQLLFRDAYGWESARDYLVFKSYDGELQCIKEFNSYYRNEAWLNNAGVIFSTSMYGYGAYSTEENFLDREGKEICVYGRQIRNGLEINLIPAELLPTNLRDSLKISYSGAADGGDGYRLDVYHFGDAADEDTYLQEAHYVFSDAAGNDAMPEDEILTLYQENGLQIHSVEEEEALLAAHKRSLGLTEAMENAEDPAWTVLKTETQDEKKEATDNIPVLQHLHPRIRTNGYSGYISQNEASYIGYHYTASGTMLNEEEAKAYPDLAAALDLAYAENDGQYIEICADLRDAAEKMAADTSRASGYVSLEHRFENTVIRADSRLYSVNVHESYFYGGAHGYEGDVGQNYDPATGRQLKLEDIILDRTVVENGIREEVEKKYAARNIDGQRLTEKIEALLNGENVPDECSWTLDYSGLHVIFNPSCLGGYALGQQKVCLDFQTYPDAVKPEYTEAPEDFIVPIVSTEEDPLRADVYNTGLPVQIRVEAEVNASAQENGYAASAVKIVLTDEYSVRASESFPAYYYGMASYYVKHGNRHFLYVFGSYENDVTELMVYELTNGEIRENGVLQCYPGTYEAKSDYFEDIKLKDYPDDDISGSYQENGVLTDPENMFLGSGMDALSTYSANRSYRIGESGVPESDELYKVFHFSDELNLTALEPISARETDAEGRETGRDVTIPVSEKLRFHMTDNQSLMIFAYGSGKYAKVSMDLNDWPQRLNGEDVETVLDGIMYAG